MRPSKKSADCFILNRRETRGHAFLILKSIAFWGTVDVPDMTPFNGNPGNVIKNVVNPERVLVLKPGEEFVLLKAVLQAVNFYVEAVWMIGCELIAAETQREKYVEMFRTYCQVLEEDDPGIKQFDYAEPAAKKHGQ